MAINTNTIATLSNEIAIITSMTERWNESNRIANWWTGNGIYGVTLNVWGLAVTVNQWAIWLRVVIVEFPCLSLPIMCFWLSFQTRWLLLWIIHVLLTRHRSLLLFHWMLLQFQWVWMRFDSLIIVIPYMFIASSAMIFVYCWFLWSTKNQQNKQALQPENRPRSCKFHTASINNPNRWHRNKATRRRWNEWNTYSEDQSNLDERIGPGRGFVWIRLV